MRKILYNNYFNIACLLLFVFYSYLFVNDVGSFWFHPEWTTDDALQQVYPFHKALYPDLFKGDFITMVMEGYLAPLHYHLCFSLTYLIGDAIMMSHFVMLIQIIVTLVFIFLGVKHYANIGVAAFACTWFIHTRSAMQRFTGGLPRGWSAPVIAAFLYFLFKENHKGVLITIFLGCLLHPPGAFLCALCYGMWLTYKIISKEGRENYFPHFRNLLLLSPIYIGTVLYVIWRPEEVGQMVDYKTALTLPEFQRPDGRFPFVPLKSIPWELHMFAIQPFWNRLFKPVWHFRTIIYYIVPIFLIFSLFFNSYNIKRKGKNLISSKLWVYLLAIAIAYFASRQVAFKLYVPDRHLQIPMSIFWVTFTPIFVHRVFFGAKKSIYFLAFFVLASLIYLGTGSGLQGSANFNYSLKKRGNVFIWLEKFTKPDSLIAGHPTFIDGTQLFAKRQAFATTETAHPFYPKYFEEMVRRHRVSLKAHYARDLSELVELLIPEGVDYFVFSKQRFYPEALSKTHHFAPLQHAAKILGSRHHSDYAYKQLPKNVDKERYPFLEYRDKQSAIVNLYELKRFLDNEN